MCWLLAGFYRVTPFGEGNCFPNYQKHWPSTHPHCLRSKVFYSSHGDISPFETPTTFYRGKTPFLDQQRQKLSDSCSPVGPVKKPSVYRTTRLPARPARIILRHRELPEACQGHFRTPSRILGLQTPSARILVCHLPTQPKVRAKDPTWRHGWLAKYSTHPQLLIFVSKDLFLLWRSLKYTILKDTAIIVRRQALHLLCA